MPDKSPEPKNAGFNHADNDSDSNSDTSLAKRSSSSQDVITGEIKGSMTETQVKNDGVWQSYNHLIMSIMVLNCIPFWVPIWQVASYKGRNLAVFHYLFTVIILILPVTYMEIFVARYMQSPPINLWKACPISIGYGYALVAYSTTEIYLESGRAALGVMYLMETVFSKAPWLQCPPNNGDKCLELSETLDLRCIAEKSKSITCPGKPKPFDFSTHYYYKMHYTIAGAAGKDGAHEIEWKIVFCAVVHWVIVTISVHRTIYTFQKFIAGLVGFVLFVSFIDWVYIMLHCDTFDILQMIIQRDYSEFTNWQLWVFVFYTSLRRMRMTVPPILMTYTARAHSKFDVTATALILCSGSFTLMFLKSTKHFGAVYLLAMKYNVTRDLLWKSNPSNSFALAPMHLATLPMPVMWMFLWFLMRYSLQWLNATMVVQANLDNVFNKFNLKKEFRIYIVVLYGFIGCIVDIIIVSKITTFTRLKAIMEAIPYDGICLLTTCESIILLIIYGHSVICTDIHFTLGAPPGLYWRLSWRVLPVLLSAMFVSYFMQQAEDRLHSTVHAPFLTTFRVMMLLIIPFFGINQLINALSKNSLPQLFNPVFDWGPQDKEVRKARKRFNPKTDIRSEPERYLGSTKSAAEKSQLSID